MADDVLPTGKFNYEPVAPEDQFDFFGDRTRPRMDRTDKVRTMVSPPLPSPDKTVDGADKRTPMDIEAARLAEADQPIESTMSPLDLLGPGAFARVARAAPSLLASVARTMRGRKPDPLEGARAELAAYRARQAPGEDVFHGYLRQDAASDIAQHNMRIERLRELAQRPNSGMLDAYRKHYFEQYGYEPAYVDRILSNAPP